VKNDTKSKNIFGPLDYSQLKNFFKYCSDDEKVIKAIFKEQQIRFTQPAALNDPLEFNPIIQFKQNGFNYWWFSLNDIFLPSEEFRLRFRLIEQQVNEFGILSLTKIPDSFDMWSRYANGHKGFLIELKSDFNKHSCMISPANKVYPVRKVQYVDEYSINVDELTDDKGQIKLEMFNDLMFYRKLSRWVAEQECRMVRPFSDLLGYVPLSNKAQRDERLHLFEFSLDCIESVTFGACMSFENRKRIRKACKGSRIKLLRAAIVRDEKDDFGKAGKIVFLSEDSIPRSFYVSQFPLIVDTGHFEDQKKVMRIASLSELPYWEDNKEWVRQMFEIRKAKQNNKS